ncbi:hypothetical protein [Mammaliicoccus lentus]|uniref:hypothetical protein n=1 Tax=Mammaliicoccus lentus TaxID=42858 RepID=UPI0010717E31|nr:hypothetical protein [Mammaliicoccus lentus]MBF0793323.1 hypothetical protein [Mammaliicoccus lentus]TFV17826.1 hypothetical protein E4T78_01575 [Mammaliicoccus lentus]
MKSPYQIERELKKKILKQDYTFEHFYKLEGETIAHMFTGIWEVEFSVLLPITIFVTENKKVFIDCFGIDKDLMEDEDIPVIEAIRRTHINQHELRESILNKKIKLNGHFTKEKLPFFDQESLKEYEHYKYNQRKEEEEKYQKEQEYKRYLELKEKYEEE